MNFDESLGALIEAVRTVLDDQAVQAGAVLRDATGQLAFFAAAALDDATKERVERAARERLGAYARPDRVVAGIDDPGARAVLSSSGRRMVVDDLTVRCVDRQIVGADWLVGPTALSDPPRFAFASLKGGVGRSTALSVVAAENARLGRNVLVLDLDLEAPGIGSMLLSQERVPPFGALDYLVERNLRKPDVAELDGCLGTSDLTAGAGLVEVVPVVGTSSLARPDEFIAKLSRGMIEAIDEEDGRRVPLAAKLGELVGLLTERRRYDLVLIDARAGLAELAAGPILQLGAHVLLFATAQRQSAEDLRLLFAHLGSLVREGEASPWDRLKMVHAKATAEPGRTSWLLEQCFELFTEYLYEEQEELEGLNYGPDDPEAPHTPIPIPFESTFVDWDPTMRAGSLAESYYQRTYAQLLLHIEEKLAARGLA